MYITETYTSSYKSYTVKVYRNPEYNDFVVRVFRGEKVLPAYDYFTICRDDAKTVAKQMLAIITAERLGSI